MLTKLKRWLIFKLIGDQPVIMNIDVKFVDKEYRLTKPILFK